MPQPPADLLRAFRETRYHGPGFVARAGVTCPALRRWMRSAGAESAAMLTAWNPGARARRAAENRRQQARLLKALRALQPLRVKPGRNVDPRGAWPTEPSLWVLGLTRSQLDRLARAFGQRAYLYSGPSGRPRLRWI